MPDGGGSSSISQRSTSAVPRSTLSKLSTSAPTAAAASGRVLPLLTRAQLAARIATGETLVLNDELIYKLDAWLPRHPGGDLAILHFVGRNAHDEIEAYHSRATLERMRRFAVARLAPEDAEKGYKPLTPPVQLGYRGGKLENADAQWKAWNAARQHEFSQSDEAKAGRESEEDAVESLLSGKSKASRPTGFPLPVSLLEPPAPPAGIDPARELQISLAWREMHQQVKDAGLYTLRPAGYGREVSRYLFLALTTALLYYHGHFLLSSLVLGLLYHQMTFTAHDAGHTGITGSHAVDRSIGVLIANWIGGLSIGWWCDNHDVHHLVTNHPEHDPDIQHMPFFAISPEFLVHHSPSSATAGEKPAKLQDYGLWSSYYRRTLVFDAPARFFLRHQHALYYVVMSLGRFNLYANSYGFLAKRFIKQRGRVDRWWVAEVAGVLCFWAYFGALLAGCPDWATRVGFLLISHIATSPLHVQIVLSHFAQSSADLGLYESFASRQIRTTMDVSCPPFLDFLHGGLHMQVSHHLFPRVPRHNLRDVRDRFVRPFAQKWGLQYELYGWNEGNERVRDTLRNVAQQVRLMAKVAEAQAKGELHH